MLLWPCVIMYWWYDCCVVRYNALVRQQASSSSGSTASLSQSTPAMNKADVVRFELDQAENRVELCKVRRRLLINSLLTAVSYTHLTLPTNREV